MTDCIHPYDMKYDTSALTSQYIYIFTFFCLIVGVCGVVWGRSSATGTSSRHRRKGWRSAYLLLSAMARRHGAAAGPRTSDPKNLLLLRPPDMLF
eukprot:COSAG01_NODE_6969_length_3412_cov_26.259885_2_plen_95_part_00